MLSREKLLKQFDEQKKHALRALSVQKENIRTAEDFWAGSPLTYNAGATEEETVMVSINRVKPFIDAVVGFMIQNRRKPQYHASILDSEEQQARSTYLNKFLNYVRTNTNADQVESQQDLAMLVGGIGAVDTNLTYDQYAATSDPNGEIIKEFIPMEEVWYDPAAKDTNLLDATYVLRAKKFYLEDAMALFERDEADFSTEIVPNNTGQFWDDRLGVTVSLDMDIIDKKMVNVFYYQWFEITKFFRVKNPLLEIAQTAPDVANLVLNTLDELKENRIKNNDNRREEQEDVFDFKPDSEVLIIPVGLKKAVKDIFQAVGIDLEFESGHKKEYFTALISGDKIFTKYKNIDQTGFSIKFKTGNYDPNGKFWFGMVKSLQEPALFLNKVTTEILDIIGASSSGGVIYEESAVDDPNKFEQEYAINGSAIKVEDGAISGNKIRDKNTGVSISGYGDLLPFFLQSLNDSIGIDKTFLGNSDNASETGVLQRQRVKRTISLLAAYFDSITLYQKEDAESMIPLMRALAEESEGRLFSVVGENGVRAFEELGLDEFADKYEVSIGEAPDNDTALDDTLKTTLSLVDRYMTTDPQTGKALTRVFVKMLPNISNEVKIELEQALADPEPTPEEQQAQQQAQEIQSQGQIAEIEKIKAQTQQFNAKAAESLAKAEVVPIETEMNSRESESKVLKNISDSNEKDANTVILEQNAGQEFEKQIVV